MISSLYPISLPQPLKYHGGGILQSVALLIEHLIVVIVDPHAVFRNNTEISCVFFTLPPVVI